jgi:hypothetical protein
MIRAGEQGLAAMLALGLAAGSSLPAAGAPERENPVLQVDSAAAGCSDQTGKPFCTVGAAIRLANSRPGADVVELAADGIYTLSLPDSRNLLEGESGLRPVASAITIHGHGSVIERSRAGHTPPFRIFWIAEAGILHLDDLTVRGGSTAAGNDGAGLWNLGVLRLENVVVTENVAGDDGGAIRNDGELTLTGCTISLNNASGTGGTGGGLYNVPVAGGGSAAISRTAFLGNRAGDHGGAVFNSSTLAAVSTTFSGNVAVNSGGAIRNVASARLNNVTLYGNQAGRYGGNLSNIGTLRLSNTAVAGGVAPEAPECEGAIQSEGHNLIQNRADCLLEGDETGNLTGVDPAVHPLQDMDGGKNKLHRPASRSPIVDAGSPAVPGSGGRACEAMDQRGEARPKDGNHDSVAICDIGAAEIGGR